MTPTDRIGSTRDELDAIAWEFLKSEFAGPTYTDWPLDRRVETFLLHAGLVAMANNGTTCHALLERIMANIRRARLGGLLGSRTASNDDEDPA